MDYPCNSTSIEGLGQLRLVFREAMVNANSVFVDLRTWETLTLRVA